MAAGDMKDSGSFFKEIVQNFTAHPAGRLSNNWIVDKCPKNGKLVIVGFAEARKIKMVKFGLCSSISDLQTPIGGSHPMLCFPSQVNKEI